MRTFTYFLFLNKILFFHNFALGLCISGVWNFQRSTGSNGCIKWIRNPRPENQCGLVFCAGPKERKVSDKSLKKKQSTFNVIKYCKSFQFHSVEISWFDVEIWRCTMYQQQWFWFFAARVISLCFYMRIKHFWKLIVFMEGLLIWKNIHHKHSEIKTIMIICQSTVYLQMLLIFFLIFKLPNLVIMTISLYLYTTTENIEIIQLLY